MTCPVFVTVRPEGNEVEDHEYGGVPPVAARKASLA
jgi:hypothetical protein